eukprot:scaffold94570_cov16-Tisochrysis_lutea.AAC.2
MASTETIALASEHSGGSQCTPLTPAQKVPQPSHAPCLNQAHTPWLAVVMASSGTRFGSRAQRWLAILLPHTSTKGAATSARTLLAVMMNSTATSIGSQAQQWLT